MIKSKLRALGVSLACAFLPVTSAMAGTIVDTGEPSGPAGYSIFDLGPANFNSVAGRFTLTQTTRITGIFSFFGTAPMGRDEALFTLHNDSNGVGSTIASENVAIGAFNLGPQITPAEPGLNNSGLGDWYGAFLFGNGPVLNAGNYWVSFGADANNPNGCFCFMPANNTPTLPFGAFRNQFTGGNWVQRNQSFGLRVFGDPLNAAVPEPATWALMITGFGFVGGALRRRKALALA